MAAEWEEFEEGESLLVRTRIKKEKAEKVSFFGKEDTKVSEGTVEINVDNSQMHLGERSLEDHERDLILKVESFVKFSDVEASHGHAEIKVENYGGTEGSIDNFQQAVIKVSEETIAISLDDSQLPDVEVSHDHEEIEMEKDDNAQPSVWDFNQEVSGIVRKYLKFPDVEVSHAHEEIEEEKDRNNQLLFFNSSREVSGITGKNSKLPDVEVSHAHKEIEVEKDDKAQLPIQNLKPEANEMGEKYLKFLNVEVFHDHKEIDVEKDGNAQLFFSNSNPEVSEIVGKYVKLPDIEVTHHQEEIEEERDGRTEKSIIDLERILEEQDTHDLYCPNCHSCITKRVVLKKRKRVTTREDNFNAKFAKDASSQVDGNISSTDPVEIKEESGDSEPEVFRCLSCFSYFIPSGTGFKLFKNFGKREEGDNVRVPPDVARSSKGWLSSFYDAMTGRNNKEDSAPLLSKADGDNEATLSIPPDLMKDNKLASDVSTRMEVKTFEQNLMTKIQVPLTGNEIRVLKDEQKEETGKIYLSDVSTDIHQGRDGEKETAQKVVLTEVSRVITEDEIVSVPESSSILRDQETRILVRIEEKEEKEKNYVPDVSADTLQVLRDQEKEMTQKEDEIRSAPESSSFSREISDQGLNQTVYSQETRILVQKNEIRSTPESSSFSRELSDWGLNQNVYSQETRILVLSEEQIEEEKIRLLDGSTDTHQVLRDEVKEMAKKGFRTKASKEDEIRSVPESSSFSREISVHDRETQILVQSEEREEEEARGVPKPKWDILKALVYGGLLESIAGLGVISAAAGSSVRTVTVVAMGLGALAGGLTTLVHNLIELKNEQSKTRYKKLLGDKSHFWMHATLAVLCFILVGASQPLVYGFSFRKSELRELKMTAVAALSLLWVILLAAGKAHYQENRRTMTYFAIIFRYVMLAISASGLSYFVGVAIQRLLPFSDDLSTPRDSTPNYGIDFM